MKEKRKSKAGRNPKLDPAVYRYTVRFNEEEHNRFLAMFGKSGVYARSVFLKAHFFGQPFKVLKVDKTLVDYYTKLSDFHAQFRAVGTNYNQVVKELRLHFSEKKAMALLYKLEQHTVELVKLSRSDCGTVKGAETRAEQLFGCRRLKKVKLKWRQNGRKNQCRKFVVRRDCLQRGED